MLLHGDSNEMILQSRRVCSTKSTSLSNKVDDFVKQKQWNKNLIPIQTLLGSMEITR